MILCIVLFIILFLMFFLVFSNLKLNVNIDAEHGNCFTLGFLFLKFKLNSKSNKKFKRKNSSKIKNNTPQNKDRAKKDDDQKLLDKLSNIKDNVTPILNIASNLKRAVLIDNLEFVWSIVKGDAADTAIFYGHTTAVFYPLLAIINDNFNLKIKNISIHPDFFNERSYYFISFRVKIKVYKLLWIGLNFLWHLLKSQLKHNKIKEL